MEKVHMFLNIFICKHQVIGIFTTFITCMNKILLLLFLFINTVVAQPGRWTWLKGDSTQNFTGSYGIQGISSPSNFPPSLYEACEFTDVNGKLWLYGGLYDSSQISVRNDLWKYDPVTNEWTWMKGTNSINDPGNFGTKGVPSPLNNPPSLGYGSASWVDNTGNFWLYGGGFNQEYGDLWKYDPLTNEWTWMTGTSVVSASPHYGSQTIPASTNDPGSRSEVASAWVDGDDLWFFGGSMKNDLWKYSISTNMWTWMKGVTTSMPLGNWGTMGVEDPLNVPSGRYSYAHWTDSVGNFWIYGGGGNDITGNISSFLADLWRYNKSTNNWTWMNGTNTNFTLGKYGARCTVYHSNDPGGRGENRAVWTDDNHDFWMLGGLNYASNQILGLNDLWKYCVSKNEWIFIGGDSLANFEGQYGTQGVSNPSSRPGERCGAISWRVNNDLYIFGGSSSFNYHWLDDLWRFEIDTTCTPCSQIAALPVSMFNINNTAFCEGNCINLTNQSTNGTSYQWFFPGGTPSSDTTMNPQNICYYTQGVYDVTLVVSNSAGTDTFSLINAINVYPPVSFAPISHQGDTLFSVAGYASYQWFYNSNPINGATNYFYLATQNGDYSVQVTDNNGCSAAATLLGVITANDEIDQMFSDMNVLVSGNSMFVKMNCKTASSSELSIVDFTGKEILKRKIQLSSGRNEIELESIHLAAGYYFLQVKNESGNITRKFNVGVKEN
jgi:PKD repeat protein